MCTLLYTPAVYIQLIAVIYHLWWYILKTLAKSSNLDLIYSSQYQLTIYGVANEFHVGSIHLLKILQFHRDSCSIQKLVKSEQSKQNLFVIVPCGVCNQLMTKNPPTLALLVSTNEPKYWKSRNLDPKLHRWNQPNWLNDRCTQKWPQAVIIF